MVGGFEDSTLLRAVSAFAGSLCCADIAGELRDRLQRSHEEGPADCNSAGVDVSAGSAKRVGTVVVMGNSVTVASDIDAEEYDLRRVGGRRLSAIPQPVEAIWFDEDVPAGGEPSGDFPFDMILRSEPYAVIFAFPDVDEPALLSPASLSLLDDASATVVSVRSSPVVRIASPLCLTLGLVISPSGGI
jgi:hypothetical protein